MFNPKLMIYVLPVPDLHSVATVLPSVASLLATDPPFVATDLPFDATNLHCVASDPHCVATDPHCVASFPIATDTSWAETVPHCAVQAPYRNMKTVYYYNYKSLGNLNRQFLWGKWLKPWRFNICMLTNLCLSVSITCLHSPLLLIKCLTKLWFLLSMASTILSYILSLSPTLQSTS